jgi:hypothetical protein
LKNFLAVIGGLALLWMVLQFPVGRLPNIGLASRSTQTHQVTYQLVTKTCIPFSVTYSLPSGTAQKDVRACDGTTQVAQFQARAGDFVYLSAQHQGSSKSGRNDGPFSCEIRVDGSVLFTVASEGFAHIAGCSGSVPR